MKPPPGPSWPVLPGDFRVSREPVVFTTLLGSCVAACLYDPTHRVAGLNHFLLPVQRAPDLAPLALTQTGRYGIDAMELLINALLKQGAERTRLRAKVFGGAALMDLPREIPGQAIGEANVRFIREFLEAERIPIEAEDLGGNRGRVIHFHTDTFDVWRRYIRNPHLEAKIEAQEAEAWRRQLARRGTEGDVTLFE